MMRESKCFTMRYFYDKFFARAQISDDYLLEVSLNNAFKYPIGYGGPISRSDYRFSEREKRIELKYVFNPSSSWASIKDSFRDIYRDILTASGNTYPKDSFIFNSMRDVVIHIDEIRTEYNLGNGLKVERIDLNEFEF